MISNRAKRAGIKELEIFDNFSVDNSLPKYQTSDQYNVLNGSNSAIGFNSSGGAFIEVPSVDGFNLTKTQKLKNWLIRKIDGKKNNDGNKSIKSISITDFFIGLSKTYEELSPIAEISKYYENAVIQAKTMGQQALVEKLNDLIDVIRGESHLIAMNLKKYVTEEQVVNFYEKVGEDKNLKLTWIRNFGRIIPEDIYKIKKDVDDRKIFDNYVILHYDPANNGEKLTKKQIEDKKDPILFGLIKNSKKLYYVADWKDEYCDLTLEDMFKELGEKVLTINNKSVKTYINKITI